MPATAALSEFNASEAAPRASPSESVSGTRAFNPDPSIHVNRGAHRRQRLGEQFGV